MVLLLGGAAPALDGSEYQKRWFGGTKGRRPGGYPTSTSRPRWRCRECCSEAIAARLLHSAHDCSDGGPAVTLAEAAWRGNIGADLAFHRLHWMAAGMRPAWPAAPTSRSSGRHPPWWSCRAAPKCVRAFEELCDEAGVPVPSLGRVGG